MSGNTAYLQQDYTQSSLLKESVEEMSDFKEQLLYFLDGRIDALERHLAEMKKIGADGCKNYTLQKGKLEEAKLMLDLVEAGFFEKKENFERNKK